MDMAGLIGLFFERLIMLGFSTKLGMFIRMAGLRKTMSEGVYRRAFNVLMMNFVREEQKRDTLTVSYIAVLLLYSGSSLFHEWSHLLLVGADGCN